MLGDANEHPTEDVVIPLTSGEDKVPLQLVPHEAAVLPALAGVSPKL